MRSPEATDLWRLESSESHYISSETLRNAEATKTITALIGKNGVGKSIVLRSVAQAFIRLDEAAHGNHVKTESAVSSMSYEVNDFFCDVSFSVMPSMRA